MMMLVVVAVAVRRAIQATTKERGSDTGTQGNRNGTQDSVKNKGKEEENSKHNIQDQQ